MAVATQPGTWRQVDSGMQNVDNPRALFRGCLINPKIWVTT